MILDAIVLLVCIACILYVLFFTAKAVKVSECIVTVGYYLLAFIALALFDLILLGFFGYFMSKAKREKADKKIRKIIEACKPHFQLAVKKQAPLKAKKTARKAVKRQRNNWVVRYMARRGAYSLLRGRW